MKLKPSKNIIFSLFVSSFILQASFIFSDKIGDHINQVQQANYDLEEKAALERQAEIDHEENRIEENRREQNRIENLRQERIHLNNR